jgi:hypothetical protein
MNRRWHPGKLWLIGPCMLLFMASSAADEPHATILDAATSFMAAEATGGSRPRFRDRGPAGPPRSQTAAAQL